MFSVKLKKKMNCEYLIFMSIDVNNAIFGMKYNFEYALLILCEQYLSDLWNFSQ